MNNQSDKFLIGLTGNIATGKSVIRNMLEHLGVYGIDADNLAHRMIYKEGPGYQKVIDVFGTGILSSNGEIDRPTLGKVVFSDHDALLNLEGIIHPLVRNTINILVKEIAFPYVVIEAIKLLESSIAKECRSIWTSYSDPNLQLERLMNSRALDEKNALQRIRAQPPQSQKTQAADLVIDNNGSYWEIWEQVKNTFSLILEDSESGTTSPVPAYDRIQLVRCTPDDLDSVSNLLSKFSKDELKVDPQNILCEMADNAYLILIEGQEEIGILRWKLNNFVSIVDQIYIDPSRHNPGFLGKIIHTLDLYITRYLAEVNILLLHEPGGLPAEILTEFDYKETNPEEITTAAWREAVNQIINIHKTVWMKEYTSIVNS